MQSSSILELIVQFDEKYPQKTLTIRNVQGSQKSTSGNTQPSSTLSVANESECNTPHVKQRRKKRDAEQMNRLEALQFPPCCVCGGNASGFHFGVNSCETCKNFFRRYLAQCKAFKCKARHECNLSDKGHICPGCLLDKCLQLGMSRDKIKLGRLSVSRRTDIINKVKQTANANGVSVSPTSDEDPRNRYPNSGGDPSTRNQNPNEDRRKRTLNLDEGKHIRDPNTDEDLNTRIRNLYEESNIRNPNSHEDQNTKHENVYEDPSTNSDINLECDIITKMLSLTCIQDPVTMFSGDVIAGLIEAKAELIKKTVGDVETDEQIKELAQECLSNYQLKQQLFGEMKPVPIDTYNALYKAHGIDVDGRMENLKLTLSFLDLRVWGNCNFIVRIPGFLRLPTIDQSNLLKASVAVLTPLLFFRFYCPEEQVFVAKPKSFHTDEMKSTFFSERFYHRLFDILCSLQNLRFNDLVLLSAIALLQPTTCSLKNCAAVEKIQESLMTLLWQEVRKTYGSSCHKMMAQLMEILFHVLEFSELYQQEYKAMSESVVFDVYPVLKEFIGT